jgi:hypothetical protein
MDASLRRGDERNGDAEKALDAPLEHVKREVQPLQPLGVDRQRTSPSSTA